MKDKSCLVYIIILLAVSALFEPVSALDKKEIPVSVENELMALIKASKQDKVLTSFNPDGVKNIVSFVLNDKKKYLYHSKLIKKRASAFCSYNMNIPLKKFINYVFNPVIPSAAISPSSVRLSGWTPKEKDKTLGLLTEKYNSIEKPLIIRGTEHTETTPDGSTGGYYSYRLKNTCILFENNKRKVLISLNKQIGKSTVGHKGYPFGPEENPYFLYTHDDGLTAFGLSWVDSYVYDSTSISVYISDGNKVKCGAFNWMYAGWAGNNMARSKHVYRGIDKYGKGLKEMLEKRSLPSVLSLVKAQNQLSNKSRNELLILAKRFYEKAEKKYKNFPDDEYEDEVKMNKMTKDQLKAIIYKEYVRMALGIETVLSKDDISFLF